MRARSARWDAAVAQSHALAVRVDVLYNRAILAQGLTVGDGTVTLDRTGAILGSLNIELIEPTRLPTVNSGGILSPYGYELAVYRGIDYEDGGLPELQALGVFPIQETGIDGVTLAAQIQANDRSQLVIDAAFEQDYQIAAGTNYATAIQAVIGAGVPGLTYQFASTTFTTPLLTYGAKTSRWDAAREMAKSIGMRVSFNGDGVCVLKLEPTLANATPLWSAVEGNGGVLTAARLTLRRGPIKNRIIATGENASNTTVYRGVATDNNPVSPTFYGPGFARKPGFYASPYITSTAQANAAAAAILGASLGAGRSVDATAVPNTAIEAGDPGLITRLAIGVNEIHIPDVITIGLGANGLMQMSTRASQDAA